MATSEKPLKLSPSLEQAIRKWRTCSKIARRTASQKVRDVLTEGPTIGVFRDAADALADVIEKLETE